MDISAKYPLTKNITLNVNLVTYRIDTAENSDVPDTVQIRKSHCKPEATGDLSRVQIITEIQNNLKLLYLR